MRTIAYLFNLFLVTILLSGCGAQKKPLSQTLRVNLCSEPQSLDPRRVRDTQSQVVVQMFFDGLTRINAHDRPELAVAERVDVSSDGKTYTFHLRESKWSNGDAVLASDFVYAWKKALDPNFPCDRAFQLYVVKNARAAKLGEKSLDEVGIKAMGPRTLQVELESAAPYFLELTALPIYFPIHQKVDKASYFWADRAEGYISNGPFLLKEWRHSDVIKAEKNPTYWDAAAVKLEKIELLMVDEETELKMYEKNELDWAGSPISEIPLNAMRELRSKLDLRTKPFLATYFFRINVNTPPFSSNLVRKAFAIAIRRQEIIDHVLQGRQIAATGLVPSTMELQEGPYFRDGDPETARKLLQQGSPDKEALSHISLLSIANEKNRMIAQAVQQQWFEAFGITVQLEFVERKTFYERTSKKDFQLAIGSWTADFSDPINFLEVFKYKNGGSNNTSWENGRYTALLDLAFTATDSAVRKKHLQECEALLIEEMPVIPLFHYTMSYLSSDRVKDVAVSKMGSIDFKWAYIAEAPR